MCGRFTVASNAEEVSTYLEDNFQITNFNLEYKPRYNVAPGQNILSVINDGLTYRVGYLKWGFVPHFANDNKSSYNMINAKAETIRTKPSFKNSFKDKRCLIIADGFYEWQKTLNQKVPKRIILKNEQLFTFAGLWSSYVNPDGTKLYTCTIITTSASPEVREIHERMPVILNSKEQQALWLNPEIKDLSLLETLLIPNREVTSYEVSTLVNNAKFDSIECIKKL